MSLTRHFDISEWTCRDGTLVPARYHRNVLGVARAAQIVRYRLQLRLGREIPMAVSSGWRTEEHNAREGGARFSQHLKGKAGDFYPKGCSIEELYQEFLDAIEDGDIEDGGLAMKPNQPGHETDPRKRGFVHYDIGPPGRRWGY